MCSNYRPPQSEALAQFNIGPPTFNYGECYPGSIGPFLASIKPDAWLPGTFGLLPHWAEPKLAKMTYNARSETVAEKPSFRTAWRNRQLCVIPVQACRRAFKTDQLCALNFDQGLKPPVIGMAVDKCNVFAKCGTSSELVGIL